MTKRKQAAVIHAVLALVAIVALALVTTWTLLAIGEGTAEIKLHERGEEFRFGGTFGLFVGLMSVFVRTFLKLLQTLASIVLFAVLCNNFSTSLSSDALTRWHSPPYLWMALILSGITVVVWV